MDDQFIGVRDVPRGHDALPHLSWDACELIFRDLQRHFGGDFASYTAYLRTGIDLLLNGTNPGGRGFSSDSDTEKLRKIGAILTDSNVDAVAVHLRTRARSSEEWIRVLSATTAAPDFDPQKADDVFSGLRLRRHAFEKARENGTLAFVFADRFVDRDSSICSIGSEACAAMLRIVRRARGRSRDASGEPAGAAIAVTADDLAAIPPAQLQHIHRYCEAHTEPQVGFESELDSFAFVIESSIVTLNNIADGTWQTPRSVLLAPVFVGGERVGGVSFFSGHAAMPAIDSARELKIFARNVLTYIAVREGQQVEIARRLAEELSPITHLFLHTFNKAFTTPILNIADEIEGFIAADADADEARDNDAAARARRERLHAIAVFLRSFSGRWAGTFPALQTLFAPGRDQHLDEHTVVRRFVALKRTALPDSELREQVRAVFAVTMANDLYDDSRFSTFAALMGDMDALDRIVTFDVNLPDRVPGNRDIWCLHLLNMAQNSLEALPLERYLEQNLRFPLHALPAFDLSITSEAVGDGGPSPAVEIRIRDGGLPFPDAVRKNLTTVLDALADAHRPPQSLHDVLSGVRNDRDGFSTKSGESFGSGIIGFAHYVSRICRVQPKPGASASPSETGEGTVVQRGRVEVGVDGCKVKVTVPVQSSGTGPCDAEICFERQRQS